MPALLAAALVLLVAGGGEASTSAERFPGVIVFGDSIVDPGNNNYLNTIAKCNFPPYGRDFEGGIPTGRFSNGKVPSDLIDYIHKKWYTTHAAESLGIKELVPAYLDPNLDPNELRTGVSFASGAAGYDPLSSQLATALSLSDQLELFKDYKEKLKASVGEESGAAIVTNSLYLIAAGSNDITNTYYLTPLRRPHYDPNSYSGLVVSYASAFFQDLYNLGARKMGILSAPPAGCLPSQRTLAGGPTRECVPEYNRLAQMYNSKLASAIRSLNASLPGSSLVYLDIYNSLLRLINDPSVEGFDVSDKGCCGTGQIEASILCTQYDSGTCEDASKYVFWDSFHPSQHTYQVLVRQLLADNYNIS
ncbi:hypothetical protein V2J09_016229 [Rumex salicifolius]